MKKLALLLVFSFLLLGCTQPAQAPDGLPNTGTTPEATITPAPEAATAMTHERQPTTAPVSGLPTPQPFPADKCKAGKTTEVDTSAGKGGMEYFGVEEATIFGRTCSVCHFKTSYGSANFVETWFSGNFESGEPGACQKTLITAASPGNPAELKTSTVEMLINGLRQKCIKQDGRMISGPETKCDYSNAQK